MVRLVDLRRLELIQYFHENSWYHCPGLCLSVCLYLSLHTHTYTHMRAHVCTHMHTSLHLHQHPSSPSPDPISQSVVTSSEVPLPHHLLLGDPFSTQILQSTLQITSRLYMTCMAPPASALFWPPFPALCPLAPTLDHESSGRLSWTECLDPPKFRL